MRVDILKGGICFKQADGCFFANTGNAGNIIGFVAHQGFVVHHLFGPDTQILFYILVKIIFGIGEAFTGQIDDDMVVHQLQQVAVTGDDFYGQSFFNRLLSHAAQNVIGFKSFHFEAGKTEDIHHLADALNLRAQIIRHFGAGGFIFRIYLIAESFPGIKGHGQVIRFVLFQKPDHHGSETINTGCWLAGTGSEMNARR